MGALGGDAIRLVHTYARRLINSPVPDILPRQLCTFAGCQICALPVPRIKGSTWPSPPSPSPVAGSGQTCSSPRLRNRTPPDVLGAPDLTSIKERDASLVRSNGRPGAGVCQAHVALAMTSVSGHHPPPMTNADSQAVMKPSRMSPSAVDLEPRGRGPFQDVPPPYDVWEPVGPGHHHGHRLQHAPPRGSDARLNQRDHRPLPPLGGLVTALSARLHSHHRPSPPSSTAPFEDRSGAASPSYTSRPSLHSPSPSLAGIVRGVAGEHAQVTPRRGREPWVLGAALVAEPEAPRDPAAPRPPQGPRPSPPRTSPSHGHPPRLQAAELHRGARPCRPRRPLGRDRRWTRRPCPGCRISWEPDERRP